VSATGGRFGKSVLISLGFTVTMAAMALANNVVISQLGGTNGRGTYALIVAIIALALPICSAGLGNAATFFLGRGRAVSEVAGLNAVVTAALLPVAVIGGVLVWRGIGGSAHWTAATFAAAAIPAAVAIELARGVYLGQGRVVAYHLCQASVIVVLIAGNAALLRYDADWVQYSVVIAYWAVALVVLPIGVRHWRPLSLPSRAQIRITLGYGVRSAGTTLADAGLLRLDYLVMAPFVSVAAVGLYAIADQVTHLMSWGGLVAGRMMLLESASDQTGDKARAKAELATRLYILVIILGSMGAAATLWWLIPFAFGTDFAPSYIGVLLLLPATLSKGIHALLSTYLTGRGVLIPIVRAGVVAVAADVVMVVVLAPTMGWTGVAIAKSCAYAIQLGLTIRAFRVHTGGMPQMVPRPEDIRAVARWGRARLVRASP